MPYRSRRLRSVALFLFLFASACDEAPEGAAVFPVGAPIGEATTATIGAAGGALAAIDGSLVLSVPPGAVASDTELSIQEITRSVPHGGGRAFRLGPEGQTFTVPVRLTFEVGAAVGGARVAYQDEAGHFVVVDGAEVDAEAGTVSVATTHFSDWTTTFEAILVADAPSVRLGQSIGLEVTNCVHRELGAGGVVDVLTVRESCVPFADVELVVIEHASVNGVEGGEASVGTITGEGDRFTYTAPAALPAANPVAVSVEVDYPGLTTQYTVVANVTVVDDAAFSGNAHMDQGAIQVTAAVSWTESEDFGGVVQYLPSGNVTYGLSGCTISPSSAAIAPDDGYLEIDYSYSPPRYYGSGTTSWTATMKCGDLPAYETTVAAVWLQVTTVRDASADGKSLVGTESFWSWSFTAP